MIQPPLRNFDGVDDVDLAVAPLAVRRRRLDRDSMGCGSSTDASDGMGSPPAKRQNPSTDPHRRACDDVVVSGLRFPEGPRWPDGSRSPQGRAPSA